MTPRGKGGVALHDPSPTGPPHPSVERPHRPLPALSVHETRAVSTSSTRIRRRREFSGESRRAWPESRRSFIRSTVSRSILTRPRGGTRSTFALKRLAAPLSDAIIAVSQKTLDGALAAGIGKPEQYVKIFSGMELEPFLGVSEHLTVAEARRRLSIPEARAGGRKDRPALPVERPRRLSVRRRRSNRGRPSRTAGSSRRRRNPSPRARGGGPAARARRSHNLRGPGPARRRSRLYIQAMDVVVHTSLREGIARVLPQAGAVGKPVVTYELDGAPEVVREGVSGFLVPPEISRRSPGGRSSSFATARSVTRWGRGAARSPPSTIPPRGWSTRSTPSTARARSAGRSVSLSWRDRSSCG